MKHNYYENMKHDIWTYMDEDPERFYSSNGEIDKDEWIIAMEDELWSEDSVTGNGSGSYTFSREEAKQNVLDDFDTVCQAVFNFGTSDAEVGRRFLAEDWEWFDVTARCFILGSALNDVADELDKYIMKMDGKHFFSV